MRITCEACGSSQVMKSTDYVFDYSAHTNEYTCILCDHVFYRRARSLRQIERDLLKEL